MNLYDEKIIVAIENEIQNMVEASGITADIFRLDGDRVINALLHALGDEHVVVPVELSDEKADSLVSKLFEGFKDIFNSEHRDLSATEREQLRLRWSRNKARTLQEDYKLLVEAARGGNEH